MVKTDKTIIAILDKIEGMERQKENFSTTIFGTFQQRMLFFQQKKLSLLSLLSLKKRKVGKSLIASVCRKKRKEVYEPTVLKKPKGGSLRAVVLKTTS